MKTDIKNLSDKLSAIRKEIIAVLKKFAKEHGEDGTTIYLSDKDIFIFQSNTEELLNWFDNKGGVGSEYDEVNSFDQCSTDLLFLILEQVTKNVNKF